MREQPSWEPLPASCLAIVTPAYCVRVAPRLVSRYCPRALALDEMRGRHAMSELDPRTNPTGYAYAFTNDYAPAYAREAIEAGTVTDTDTPGVLTPDEWAHETADSLAAVIYTGQAVALFASGLFDSEDDDLAASAYAGEDSALAGIDAAIVALSYTWHKRILSEAAEELLSEREDDGDDD